MGISKKDIVARIPELADYPELLKSAHARLMEHDGCGGCNSVDIWESIRRQLENAKMRDKGRK